jgi:universal stress protein A
MKPTKTNKRPGTPNRHRRQSARSRLGPFKLQHILVPIDFSEASRQAVAFAVPLARKFAAMITLVHVVQPVVYPDEVGPWVVSEQLVSKASSKELAAWGKKLMPAALLKRTIVRFGQPYHEIAEAARTQRVDLLVITTHGRTGLQRALLGSTAERVVRHAPCPVLTVRVH